MLRTAAEHNTSFSRDVSNFFPDPKPSEPGNSLSDLSQTLAGLSFRPAARAVIAIGYGVPDGELPLRSLAYIVPALRLLVEMPPASTLDIYVAAQGCLRANPHADSRKILANSEILQRALAAYVSERYPDLAGRVRVLEDAAVETNSELEAFISSLTDLLEQKAPGDPVLSDFAQRRGGREAYRYMAEHAIYMRDSIQPKPAKFLLVPEMETTMDCVVMVGGRAEKLFYRARELIRSELDAPCEWKTEQLFTPLGAVRPCYFREQEEPALDDRRNFPRSIQDLVARVSAGVKSGASGAADRHVLSDLLILLADLGEFSFLPEKNFLNGLLAGKAPSGECRALERGLQRLGDMTW